MIRSTLRHAVVSVATLVALTGPAWAQALPKPEVGPEKPFAPVSRSIRRVRRDSRSLSPTPRRKAPRRAPASN